MKEDTSKSTILVISMGFLILYLIFSWKWAVIVSLIVGIIGIVSASLSKIIETGWMRLANLLNHTIPPVLLGIVFFGVLLPISLISKLFTKDPLMLSNKHSSYFVDIDRDIDSDSFKKTW